MTATCEVCKDVFSSITAAHVRRHGLTIRSYRDKYPTARLSSDEFLERRGKAIAKALAKPEVRRQSSASKRAIYADPVKGKGIREGLRRGRIDPVARAKAKKTMQVKAATTPGYGEFMGKISRIGWAKPNKVVRQRIKKLRQAMRTPEARERSRQTITRQWAERNAILQAYKGEAVKPVRRKGRVPGLTNDTIIRIQLAAAFTKLEWSQRKMSPHLFPETPATAYVNTRNLFSEHRSRIATLSASLLLDNARSIASNSGAQL